MAPLDEAVEEPANPTFAKARAPTIPEKDENFVPVKNNFSEKFKPPEFTGKFEVPKLN